MAAERKLKGEIDRTLKKVQEGQEVFADIWNQCVESENQNQREKLEGELKKEIKKLQRLREQIKGWIAGADIKDKQPLLDMRKSIERDMERFKALEKEAKAKGYSGMAAAKNDPKERAKEECRDWINNTVDSLTSKVECKQERQESQADGRRLSPSATAAAAAGPGQHPPAPADGGSRDGGCGSGCSGVYAQRQRCGADGCGVLGEGRRPAAAHTCSPASSSRSICEAGVQFEEAGGGIAPSWAACTTNTITTTSTSSQTQTAVVHRDRWYTCNQGAQTNVVPFVPPPAAHLTSSSCCAQTDSWRS